MTLRFREAREADLDRLVEIHLSAFPDARGIEPRLRNFTHNPLGKFADLVVAEQSGAIVAHAFLFALEAWFGGVRVKTGGVASVGVAPEARGTGVGRALLADLHARALARGDAVTLLYPFRQGFYSASGYAVASSYRRLVVSPRSLPHSDPANGHGATRPATGDDREAMVALHEEVAARSAGWIARPPSLWNARLLNERRRWFVLEQQGHLEGFIAWSLEQDEPHAAIELTVDELVARDDTARMRLLALVGAQRDQIAQVQLDVADDDPLERALMDLDRDRWGSERIEHPLGTLVGGPMVRILDVERAIEARGYLAEGDLDLALLDEGAVHVQARGGRAKVGTPRGGPVLRVDRAALSAILYGSLRPTAGARLGYVTTDDPETLRLADALFALPAFFAIDSF